MRAKGNFDELDTVIQEYFHLGHAEKVQVLNLHKPMEQVFYLPMHTVRKESSTTTKQWRIQTGFHSFRGNPLLADLKHERFTQWLLFSVVATS